MIKIKLKNGYVAYKIKTTELIKLGGWGVCDYCNKTENVGYLIPVLNRWYCEACFRDWLRTSRFYPDDKPFENRNCKYYEHLIKVEKEVNEEECDIFDSL